MAEATVTARGEAVAPGRPDEGIWTLEVAAVKDMPDAALADVGARSMALDALLDEMGIAKEQRSTTGVTVREELEWVEDKQVHRGFRASNVLTVRLADASVAGTLIQEAIARAAAGVNGPVWWIAPDNPARIEACRAAAADAKRKAEAYAEALGLRIGAVAEIREPAIPMGVMPMARMQSFATAAAGPAIQVDPGTLDVTAQVEVSFFLEA